MIGWIIAAAAVIVAVAMAYMVSRDWLAARMGKWRERAKTVLEARKRRRKADEIMGESHGSDRDWIDRKR